MKSLAFTALLLLSTLLVRGTFAQSEANWTILHYTAVDNNLEGDAFNDYYEMQSVGSGNGVNIVGQLDRAEGYDNRFGDWTGTRRFFIEYVEPQPTPDIAGMRAAIVDHFVQQGAGEAEALRAEVDAATDQIVTQLYDTVIAQIFEQTPVEDLGEVDMGDPQSLVDFIIWGVQNYPAEHYMLVIGSHGGGWRGIGPDEGDGESMLDLPEIDAALSEARATLGLEKFDIVGFDACLMSVIDVAVTLEPHADYVISSQEVIPSAGWEYRSAISAMQANPDWDAFPVGAGFIDSYMEYYAGPGARTKVGLSLVETAQLPRLLDSLQNFAQVVGADTTELLSALGTARNNSQAFGTALGDRADLYSYIDLRDFMNWFSLQTTITEDAYNAALEVIAAFDSAVVYSLADTKLPRANGLAIYLPATPVAYFGYGESYPADAPADFAFWQDYLDRFYATITDELDGSALQLEITDVFTISGSGGILDNPVVSFDAGGLGVVDLNYTITFLENDGSRTIVDSYPIAYNTTLPSGEVIVEYPNALTPSTFTWGAEVPILSDGINSVLGLAQSSSSSGGEAYIQGTYVSVAGALPAYLVFDSADLSYIGLLAVTNESPAQVIPAPGEQFVVDLVTISAEVETAVTPLTNSPLTFGVQPFILTYQPALSGDYEIGLSMSDLAGNRIYRSTAVSIDNSQANGDLRGYTDISNGIYFQYPRAWGDASTIENEDGTLTNTVSSTAGDHAIYVDVYAATDIETALYGVIDMFPAEYGDIAELTFAQLPALAVDFAVEDENGTTYGTIISVFNEAVDAAVVFTVQVAGDEAPAWNDLVGLLDGSTILFEPVAS